MSPSNMISVIVATCFVVFIGLGNFLCSIMQPRYAIQFDQGKALGGHNCVRWSENRECQEVVDRSELEIYWSKIGATLGGYDVRPVAAYTPFEQLEGDAVDGAAVLEFPSMELAKAWYNSPAYRAIIHHRQQGARYIGLLMEGGRRQWSNGCPTQRTANPITRDGCMRGGVASPS